MIDEIINNSIKERIATLTQRKGEMPIYNDLEKGKAAQEGEVRTHGGVKVRKVAGKWIPVAERRQPPTQKSKGEKSSKKEDPKKGKVSMPAHVNSHHVGTLRSIKKLHASGDHSAAHELASKLPDEVKHEIPPKVWEEMIDGHTKNQSEEKAKGEAEKQAKTDEKAEKEASKAESEEKAKDTPEAEIEADTQSRFKSFVSKHKDMFDTGEHAHPDRSKAAKFLRGKAKGIVKGLKHEMEHMKEAAGGLKKLVTGKKLDKHDKKAMRKVGISLGLTVGTMLATGGTSIFAHGAGAFLKHLGIHFVEHALIETTGLAMMFAKAVEEVGNGELTEEELTHVMTKITEEFITYIEKGDWSTLKNQK